MIITDGFVRKFDDLGRILIPKEIRIKLFGKRDTDGEPNGNIYEWRR